VEQVVTITLAVAVLVVIFITKLKFYLLEH
jgi:hypothetical protein